MRGRPKLTTLFSTHMLVVPAALALCLFLLLAIFEVRELRRQSARFVSRYRETELAKARASVLAIVANFSRMSEQAERDAGGSLRASVEAARGLAERIYQDAKVDMSGGSVRRLIVNCMREIPFGRARLFIYDGEGRQVLGSLRSSLPEASARLMSREWEAQIVDTLLQQALGSGESAFEYSWPSSAPAVPPHKATAYARRLSSLGWVIGGSISADEAMEEAKREAVQWLAQQRTAEHGYPWVIDTNLQMVFHPYATPEAYAAWYSPGGLADYRDSQGTPVFQDMLEMCLLNRSGFVSYSWKLPGTSAESRKTSFVALVPEWNWIVGVGIYDTDLAEVITANGAAFSRSIAVQILISLLIIGAAVGLSHAAVSIFARRLRLGLGLFESFFRTAAVERQRIELGDLPYAEMQDLAGLANQMLDERQAADARLVKREEQLRHTQKMEAMGRMAAGVAHDFNSVLTGILGYVEILSARPDLDAESRADVGEIRDASYRAKTIVRQMLSFSHRHQSRPRLLQMNSVVSEISRLLRRVVGGSHSLDLDLDPAAGSLWADPAEMEQVILNCVVNARDAMPEGGVIRISTSSWLQEPDRPPAAETMTPGQYVMLAVRDTGCGMDEETRTRVFEPFFTTKEGSGTGLGLSIVYGIVRRHGGFIDLQSAPLHGTTIRFLFPRVKDDSEAVFPRRQLLPSANCGETILVVEDAQGTRERICAALTLAGYAVLTASNGADAFGVLRSRRARIHLMLTDVVLPDMTGEALCERVAELLPGVAMLFVSAISRNDAMFSRIAARRGTFLPNPFSEETLVRIVRETIDCKAGDAERAPVSRA